MDFEAELLKVIVALDDSNIDHAICGGLAVAIHGFARATKDIDLLIPRDQIDRAVETLKDQGYDIDAGTIPFAAGSREERAIRRLSKASNQGLLSVALLELWPIYADVWTDLERFEWNSRHVNVVSARGLQKMKRVSGRPKDLLDLEELDLTDALPSELPGVDTSPETIATRLRDVAQLRKLMQSLESARKTDDAPEPQSRSTE